MHAICEKEFSLGKWKKVDDAQCLQKCPYAASENEVLEEKSLLELKALRIEKWRQTRLNVTRTVRT